jgi:hypothetical protein
MPLCGVSMLLSFGVGAYLGWWDLRPRGPYSESKFRFR